MIDWLIAEVSMPRWMFWLFVGVALYDIWKGLRLRLRIGSRSYVLGGAKD